MKMENGKFQVIILNKMSKKHKPADEIQDIQFFGEFGGVNPSITDSSTFTYLAGKTMEEVFDGGREGCYLYSRHINPSNQYLSKAIASMEDTEAAVVTSSGMAAISSTILQICSSGDNIISSNDRLINPIGWVWSFGFGPRFILLGRPWQLDYAWQYNPIKKELSTVRWYLSIGLDF